MPPSAAPSGAHPPRPWLGPLGVGLLVLGLLMLGFAAVGARPGHARSPVGPASPPSAGLGPAASAADIPALAELLAETGWTPTPELSGVFQVGAVFHDDGDRHTLMLRDCFDAEPAVDTYTAMELVTRLQAGVRVRGGLFRAEAEGELSRNVRFGVPEHHTVERLAMTPTSACAAQLARVDAESQDQMYAIQEVLTAEIAEQTCGRVDAEGRWLGGVGLTAEAARACARVSLEPVAVGYRTVPLSALVDVHSPATSGAAISAPAALTQIGTPACPWAPIRTVSTTMKTLTVNGQTTDVRGVEQRTFVAQTMQRCGRPEAARAFEEWRLRRRTVNVTGATLIGFWPLGFGMLAAMQADDWRTRTEQLLLDPGLAYTRKRGWQRKVRVPVSLSGRSLESVSASQ